MQDRTGRFMMEIYNCVLCCNFFLDLQSTLALGFNTLFIQYYSVTCRPGHTVGRPPVEIRTRNSDPIYHHTYLLDHHTSCNQFWQKSLSERKILQCLREMKSSNVKETVSNDILPPNVDDPIWALCLNVEIFLRMFLISRRYSLVQKTPRQDNSYCLRTPFT